MTKHVLTASALLVFLAIALAFYLERPEPPDSSLFGAEVALASELAPLALPHGTLELSGHVRASDGASAADAFIALLRDEDDPGEAEPLYHGYTDEAGLFTLSGLEPGTYRVLLTHPDAPPRSFPLVLPVEGEVQWELAEPLEPLPVLPELVRAATSGRVRMPATLAAGPAASLAGFEVVLRPAPDVPPLAGACTRRATTAADGGFALGELVATRYLVEVLPPWARGGSWPVLARARYEARAEGTDPLELFLEVGTLEGELQEADGRPLAGALIKVGGLDARDPVGDPQLWPPGVTDPAGRFRVELLPPGRYLVHLRAGSAARDLEVRVEGGKITSVPLVSLDPRARTGG